MAKQFIHRNIIYLKLNQMETKQNLLRNEISSALEKNRRYRNNNKKKAFRFHIIITVLAAITTVILGLNIELYANYIRITALIIGAIITIISTWNTFYNHKELWINHTILVSQLKELLFDLDYLIADKPKVIKDSTQKIPEKQIESDTTETQMHMEFKKELEIIKNKYFDIIGESYTDWRKLRLDKKNIDS